jgi:aspartate-semialdehyde dehydrogenase
MTDNVIPFIGGEEEKSEKEPLKIWGTVEDGVIKNANSPVINATCIRVPVSDGHMASVWALFENMPTKSQIIEAVTNYNNPIADLELPSAPTQLIQYFEEDDRPQTKLDRDYENGMGISLGRLRQVGDNEWQFIALSHNTLRGAAGGAVLMGELLVKQGYITKK